MGILGVLELPDVLQSLPFLGSVLGIDDFSGVSGGRPLDETLGIKTIQHGRIIAPVAALGGAQALPFFARVAVPRLAWRMERRRCVPPALRIHLGEKPRDIFVSQAGAGLVPDESLALAVEEYEVLDVPVALALKVLRVTFD